MECDYNKMVINIERKANLAISEAKKIFSIIKV